MEIFRQDYKALTPHNVSLPILTRQPDFLTASPLKSPVFSLLELLKHQAKQESTFCRFDAFVCFELLQDWIQSRFFVSKCFCQIKRRKISEPKSQSSSKFDFKHLFHINFKNARQKMKRVNAVSCSFEAFEKLEMSLESMRQIGRAFFI